MNIDKKVQELLSKEYRMDLWDCYNDSPNTDEWMLEQQIDNSLIVVNEVLWALSDIDGEENMSNWIDWWEEVKEKLLEMKTQ